MPYGYELLEIARFSMSFMVNPPNSSTPYFPKMSNFQFWEIATRMHMPRILANPSVQEPKDARLVDIYRIFDAPLKSIIPRIEKPAHCALRLRFTIVKTIHKSQTVQTFHETPL